MTALALAHEEVWHLQSLGRVQEEKAPCTEYGHRFHGVPRYMQKREHLDTMLHCILCMLCSGTAADYLQMMRFLGMDLGEDQIPMAWCLERLFLLHIKIHIRNGMMAGHLSANKLSHGSTMYLYKNLASTKPKHDPQTRSFKKTRNRNTQPRPP